MTDEWINSPRLHHLAGRPACLPHILVGNDSLGARVDLSWCSKRVLEDHATSYRSAAVHEVSRRSGKVARIASADTSAIAMNKSQAPE